MALKAKIILWRKKPWLNAKAFSVSAWRNFKVSPKQFD